MKLSLAVPRSLKTALSYPYKQASAAVEKAAEKQLSSLAKTDKKAEKKADKAAASAELD